MLRIAIIPCTAHGVAGPFVSQFSRASLLPRVLAKVKSRTTTARRVGKGLGILLHYAKESNERNTRPKLKEQRVRSHKTRGAYPYNNCCSFSLEKQKAPPRKFSPLEKDAPPYLDRRTHRILMHV